MDKMIKVPSMNFLPAVLKGETVGIARMISRAETGNEECRPAMAEIFRCANKAHVVGITGVPGSGKSMLTSSLTAAIRKSGRKVGIIAIDPTSPFSGGSILGDRIRMADVALDPGVFIRSMATHGALGGLSKACLDAVDILDAAGFDIIIIETVGVGQDEVEIVQAAHTVVVISAPGLGDDIQAIKAGILEIADIHIVSKCDRPDSNDTIVSLKGMLKLGDLTKAATGWERPVIATSVFKEQGIGELAKAIDDHHEYLVNSGELRARRRKIVEMRMLKIAEGIIRQRFHAERDEFVSSLSDQMVIGRLDPYSAASQLLLSLNEEMKHASA